MEYVGWNETNHHDFVSQEYCVLFPLKGTKQEVMW